MSDEKTIFQVNDWAKLKDRAQMNKEMPRLSQGGKMSVPSGYLDAKGKKRLWQSLDEQLRRLTDIKQAVFIQVYQDDYIAVLHTNGTVTAIGECPYDFRHFRAIDYLIEQYDSIVGVSGKKLYAVGPLAGLNGCDYIEFMEYPFGIRHMFDPIAIKLAEHRFALVLGSTLSIIENAITVKAVSEMYVLAIMSDGKPVMYPNKTYDAALRLKAVKKAVDFVAVPDGDHISKVAVLCADGSVLLNGERMFEGACSIRFDNETGKLYAEEGVIQSVPAKKKKTEPQGAAEAAPEEAAFDVMLAPDARDPMCNLDQCRDRELNILRPGMKTPFFSLSSSGRVTNAFRRELSDMSGVECIFHNGSSGAEPRKAENKPDIMLVKFRDLSYRIIGRGQNSQADLPRTMAGQDIVRVFETGHLEFLFELRDGTPFFFKTSNRLNQLMKNLQTADTLYSIEMDSSQRCVVIKNDAVYTDKDPAAALIDGIEIMTVNERNSYELVVDAVCKDGTAVSAEIRRTVKIVKSEKLSRYKITQNVIYGIDNEGKLEVLPEVTKEFGRVIRSINKRAPFKDVLIDNGVSPNLYVALTEKGMLSRFNIGLNQFEDIAKNVTSFDYDGKGKISISYMEH